MYDDRRCSGETLGIIPALVTEHVSEQKADE
jgi:hypothetical protein